jgi:hypothetical protein
MAELFVAQLAEVERAVRAVVERDEERLNAIAPEGGDLYRGTRDYGKHGTVELVMPPGPASEWNIEVIAEAGDASRTHVVVEMWTREEGRSDLSLTLELKEVAPRRWIASIHDLHVL